MRVTALCLLFLALVTGWVVAQEEEEDEEPQPASLTVLFSNNGRALAEADHAKFYVRKPGNRDAYIDWGHAARTARFIEGIYDLEIRYEHGEIVEQIKREEVELSGDMLEEIDFRVPIAELTLEITNGGVATDPFAGSYMVYREGRRDRLLATKRPGDRLVIRPGSYDIRVSFRDPEGLKTTWLEGYYLEGERHERVEMGLPLSHLTLTLLDRRRPLSADEASWRVYQPGQRRAHIAERGSGEQLALEAGVYDIGAVYRRGDQRVERWLTNVAIDGLIEREIDMGFRPTALQIDVTRDGERIPNAWYTLYRPGERETGIVSAASGAEVSVEPGTYDIGAFLRERGTRAESWISGRDVSGKRVELDVELETKSASLRVLPLRTSDARGNNRVLILLDDTSSMLARTGGSSRFEVVGPAVSEVLAGVTASSTNIGLRRFGGGSPGSRGCGDSELLVPPAGFDRKRLVSEVQTLQPGGEAPLAHAIEQARRDLPAERGNSLVLITSTVDTCDQDACAAAAKLVRDGIVDQIFVIGFDAGREPSRRLDCIGQYYRADGPDQLKASLREILQSGVRWSQGTLSVFRADRTEEWVAGGFLGETIQLSAGLYDILIHNAGNTYLWEDVNITGDLEVVASRTAPPTRRP